MMEGNNKRWEAVQADVGEANTPEWRLQLQGGARQRIVNKIMDTLKKDLPISGPEGLGELKKIVVRFEEKIYTAAISQSDYLRKISMKMLTMEQKTQGGGVNGNPLPSTSGAANQNSSDPASVDSTGQTSELVPEWQEGIYQKILSMKEKYYPELHELSQKLGIKLQQQDPLPPPSGSKQVEQLENMKKFKNVLDRMVQMLLDFN